MKYLLVFLSLVLFSSSVFAQETFIKGDSNNDNRINLSDAVHILGYAFISPEEYPLACQRAADTDGNERITITDAQQILIHLFQGPEILDSSPILAENCALNFSPAQEREFVFAWDYDGDATGFIIRCSVAQEILEQFSPDIGAPVTTRFVEGGLTRRARVSLNPNTDRYCAVWTVLNETGDFEVESQDSSNIIDPFNS